jgi:hypothetical protein
MAGQEIERDTLVGRRGGEAVRTGQVDQLDALRAAVPQAG